MANNSYFNMPYLRSILLNLYNKKAYGRRRPISSRYPKTVPIIYFDIFTLTLNNLVGSGIITTCHGFHTCLGHACGFLVT